MKNNSDWNSLHPLKNLKKAHFFSKYTNPVWRIMYQFYPTFVTCFLLYNFGSTQLYYREKYDQKQRTWKSTEEQVDEIIWWWKKTTTITYEQVWLWNMLVQKVTNTKETNTTTDWVNDSTPTLVAENFIFTPSPEIQEKVSGMVRKILEETPDKVKNISITGIASPEWFIEEALQWNDPNSLAKNEKLADERAKYVEKEIEKIYPWLYARLKAEGQIHLISIVNSLNEDELHRLQDIAEKNTQTIQSFIGAYNSWSEVWGKSLDLTDEEEKFLKEKLKRGFWLEVTRENTTQNTNTFKTTGDRSIEFALFISFMYVWFIYAWSIIWKEKLAKNLAFWKYDEEKEKKVRKKVEKYIPILTMEEKEDLKTQLDNLQDNSIVIIHGSLYYVKKWKIFVKRWTDLNNESETGNTQHVVNSIDEMIISEHMKKSALENNIKTPEDFKELEDKIKGFWDWTLLEIWWWIGLLEKYQWKWLQKERIDNYNERIKLNESHYRNMIQQSEERYQITIAQIKETHRKNIAKIETDHIQSMEKYKALLRESTEMKNDNSLEWLSENFTNPENQEIAQRLVQQSQEYQTTLNWDALQSTEAIRQKKLEEFKTQWEIGKKEALEKLEAIKKEALQKLENSYKQNIEKLKKEWEEAKQKIEQDFKKIQWFSENELAIMWIVNWYREVNNKE